MHKGHLRRTKVFLVGDDEVPKKRILDRLVHKDLKDPPGYDTPTLGPRPKSVRGPKPETPKRIDEPDPPYSTLGYWQSLGENLFVEFQALLSVGTRYRQLQGTWEETVEYCVQKCSEEHLKHYIGTDIFILAYNCNNPQSLVHLENVWARSIEHWSSHEDPWIIMVGSRMAATDRVPQEDVKKAVERIGVIAAIDIDSDARLANDMCAGFVMLQHIVKTLLRMKLSGMKRPAWGEFEFCDSTHACGPCCQEKGDLSVPDLLKALEYEDAQAGHSSSVFSWMPGFCAC